MSPRSVWAQHWFSPTLCQAACGVSWVEVPWDYRSQHLPGDPNNTTSYFYINNIDYVRKLATSDYVYQVGFYKQTFDTEVIYDTLEYGVKGGSTTMLYGDLSPSWHDTQVLNWYWPGYWARSPLYTRFYTGASSDGSYFGFEITNARVCCVGIEFPTNYPLTPLERHDGLLIETDDVVYFKDSGPFSSAQGLNYVIGSADYASHDFDLFVRCNARPTIEQFDYVSRSGSSDEFIHIPAAGNYCLNGTVYIAVHSWQGSGAFYIVKSAIKPASVHNLVACTDFNADATQQWEIINSLTTAGRLYYGMTEGQSMVNRFDFYNNVSNCIYSSPTMCDICYTSQTWTKPGSCASNPNMHVTIYGNSSGVWYSNNRLLTHEMAHCWWSQSDEYEPDPDKPDEVIPQCGHSIMGDLAIDNYNVCTVHNHEKDKHPLAGDSGEDPGWENVSWYGLAVNIPTKTPDNTAYYYHEFVHAGSSSTVYYGQVYAH